MNIATLPLPEFFIQKYAPFKTLTPIQSKAIQAGLLNDTSQLICAPTASGKTLVGTMGICNHLGRGKALYLVPLKALAAEKYKHYQSLFTDTRYTVAMSVGDVEKEQRLAQKDLIILTTEKLDALMRHHVPWIQEVKVVVVDEIHLLHDPSRGPTLEIILTLLKLLIKPQIIGLSATIGNPQELADWLGATLVQDSWRPVELKKGIYAEGKTTFYP